MNEVGKYLFYGCIFVGAVILCAIIYLSVKAFIDRKNLIKEIRKEYNEK